MALSRLFGKKKGKDEESPDRASSDNDRADPTRRAQDAAARRRVAGSRSPPTLSPRDVARATAEKIDLIESQIESEIMQSRSDYTASQTRRPSAPRANEGRPASSSSTISATTDLMLGDSQLANSMELQAAGNPVLEEAAILFANGQDLPAIAVLAAAVQNDRSPETWLMLLELYQSSGKRAEFDKLAVDFAVRFETSAPAWSDEQAKKTAKRAAPPAARAAIVFKGTLDARIVPQLEELKKLAQRHAVLHLAFEQVTSVDAQGADLILRVFAAFEKSNHEVAISGATSLAERLREAIEVGRRDASNAVWMLLLEVYRILGRQDAFEEASIDYCVTYEVSPPSWEPASSKYLVEDGTKSPGAATAPAANEDGAVDPPLGADHVALVGDLVGKSEAELGRLTQFANDRQHVVVDCAKLARVDFTAAGLLLNWAVGMRGQKKDISFVHVGHLVAALFMVMGLHEVVPIERRKV